MPDLQEELETPGKTELKGWTAHWTLTDVTGFADEQVLDLIDKLGSSLAARWARIHD